MLSLHTLGNTGLLVSPLGLGTAALGRPGYITLGHGADLHHNYDKQYMKSRSHALFQKAYDSGIRYFDAARSYGLAENFLGDWVRDQKTSSVIVGSKWGYEYTANWEVDASEHEVKNHGIDQLQKQWVESSGLLGDQLKLYQVHSATLTSGILDNQSVHLFLNNLKCAHGVKIGLSVTGNEQSEIIRRAMNIRMEGVPLFDVVQVTYNLFEAHSKSILMEAHEKGIGIIVKEALANGRLTDRNMHNDACRGLGKVAQDYGVTIDSLALAFILREEWADVVLSGAVTIEQLDSNLQALTLDLTDGDINKLSNLTEHDYWHRRKALRWN